MLQPAPYRLLTRSDFDGVVCAVLLKFLNLISEVVFVHPKDMQDRRVPVDKNDIITDLPHHPDARLVFDRHASGVILIGEYSANYVNRPNYPSCARIIYEYYMEESNTRWPDHFKTLVEAADKAGSGNFNQIEVLLPQGWTLLNFLLDPRTGLSRFQNLRIKYYPFVQKIIELCSNFPIERILKDEDVVEYTELYFSQSMKFLKQLSKCSRIIDNVVFIDLRGEKVIYSGNRFLVYAIFPQISISVHVTFAQQRIKTIISLGKSILNRSSKVHIGRILSGYGGGGHAAAGTCQVTNQNADIVIQEILEVIMDKSKDA